MQSADLHTPEPSIVSNKNIDSPAQALQGEQKNSEERSLLDYIEILAKNWKMIVFAPFIAAVITAVIALLMPNIFTAKTMIIPSDSDSGGMGVLMGQLGGLASIAGNSLGIKTASDLYVTMLQSEAVKDPIIDKFKLVERYKAEYRTDVYKKLDGTVLITLGKKDGIISISVDEEDPKLAADIANAYVEELGQLTARLNMSGAGQNRIFLEKRIAKANTELAKAEDALKEFQLQNKAISVTEQARATIEGVAQLRAQLATQEVQLASLHQRFTDQSQEVRSVKASIANLRAQINSMEGKGFPSSSIPSVGVVPQLGQEFMRLTREFKIQEAVVEMLTKQYEVAKVSENKDVSPFQILQKAKVPERKSKPAKTKMVLLAACVTGLLMIFFAIVLENINSMPSNAKNRWKSILQLLPGFSLVINRMEAINNKS